VLDLQISSAIGWRDLSALGDGSDGSVFIVKQKACCVDRAENARQIREVGALAAMAQYRHRVAIGAVVRCNVSAVASKPVQKIRRQ
jgi:hypothetical protein